METKFSFGKIQLDVSPGDRKAGRRLEPDLPFVLAIAGDFSGRANRGLVEPLGQRRAWRVDCDNFEKVMAGVAPKLRLPLPEGPAGTIDLQVETLEDFHPDRLLRTVTSLSHLMTARERARNPATRTEAARELQALISSRPSPPEPEAPRVAGGGAESNEETLARLLGSPARPQSAPGAQANPAVERLIRNIVAPSIVPGASPQETALVSAVELELGRLLRCVLHHPDFQALEATWRSLDMLVRNFGGEENLKLRLLDISRQEITADLTAQENLGDCGLHKLLQSQADEAPWGAWVGLYTFGGSVGEIEVLGRLARLAAGVTAPFLGGASPGLAGCASFGTQADPGEWRASLGPEVQAAWRALRELPESAYAALALPRFLLRQPYGKGSDPIQGFPFEEMAAENPHESYLWGNPAVLCGWILAERFREEGWQMQPGGFGEVGDLPLYRFKQDGETTVKPCAEAWLNQRAGDAISEKGLVPVMSIKGKNAVRVGPLRSLRSPPSGLAGAWGE